MSRDWSARPDVIDHEIFTDEIDKPELLINVSGMKIDISDGHSQEIRLLAVKQLVEHVADRYRHCLNCRHCSYSETNMVISRSTMAVIRCNEMVCSLTGQHRSDSFPLNGRASSYIDCKTTEATNSDLQGDFS